MNVVVLHICAFGCRENDLKGEKMRFFGVLGSERECSLDMVESVTTLTSLANLALIDFFPYIYRRLSVSY